MTKKLTVIGGGTGLSVILRGLKHLHDIELRAVVTVADDGGSTGRLREQYQIPAMGDLRSVILAMSKEESLFSRLMNYRFGGNGEMGGHNLGNIMLTAITEITGNFNEAISSVCKILNVEGEILPATNENVSLYALMDDGVVVKGEHNIPEYHHHIQQVYYDHDVSANPRAVEVIMDADMIVLGIGSLYTSILPNLIIRGIQDAMILSKAKKVYVCNAMSQGGETDHYSVEDHVNAIHAHLRADVIDTVIANNTAIPQDILRKYTNEGAHAITLRENAHRYRVIEKPLLDFSKGLVRHNETILATLIEELLKES